VNAYGSGNRVVNLKDSAGNVIQSKTVNMPNGVSTVTLNFPIPIGNDLKLCISGTINLYRNKTGATYPYYSSDSSVILTNSDAGQPGYYYFFYNWKLQAPSCASGRIPVNVDVFGSGDSFTPTVNQMTASFNPTNSGATSYTWSFGDGTSSSQMNPTHSYPSTGKYSVKLVETNGTCYDSVTRTVNIINAGTNDIKLIGSVSISPNPAINNLQLQVTSQQVNDNYTLSIHNILGEAVISKPISLVAGDNKLNIDVSGLTAGVYFLRINGKGGVAETKKFTKE